MVLYVLCLFGCSFCVHGVATELLISDATTTGSTCTCSIINNFVIISEIHQNIDSVESTQFPLITSTSDIHLSPTVSFTLVYFSISCWISTRVVILPPNIVVCMCQSRPHLHVKHACV